MGWNDRMKEWGGGDFTFLSTDGEAITFIVVGDPIMLKSTYKGKEQDRIGCPVVTDEGYQLLVCGKRLARKIGKREADFEKCAFTAIRHGGEGDPNSTYELITVPEKECYDRLKAVADHDFKPEMVEESVKNVKQVLDN